MPKMGQKTVDAMITALQKVQQDDMSNLREDTRPLVRRANELIVKELENVESSTDRPYLPALDEDRLNNQLGVVFELMTDGLWHSAEEVHASMLAGGPDRPPRRGKITSVSAHIRALRKTKHGGWIVDDEIRGAGHYVFRLRNFDGSLMPPRPKNDKDNVVPVTLPRVGGPLPRKRCRRDAMP